MYIRTTPILIHLIPLKPIQDMHPADRELVGVYSVEVDEQDYPAHQAIAGLNSIKSNISLQAPGDFLQLVYDPCKGAWLVCPQGDQDFPSDGQFNGKVESIPLWPTGALLVGKKDTHGHDESGKEQIAPAGSLWLVAEATDGQVTLVCEQAGTCAVIDALEILPLFEFRTGYAEDKGLSADELDSKYNPFGDGEHPLFPRFMWREAVLNKDTISGYWAWLVKSIEQSEGLVS